MHNMCTNCVDCVDGGDSNCLMSCVGSIAGNLLAPVCEGLCRGSSICNTFCGQCTMCGAAGDNMAACVGKCVGGALLSGPVCGGVCDGMGAGAACVTACSSAAQCIGCVGLEGNEQVQCLAQCTGVSLMAQACGVACVGAEESCVATCLDLAQCSRCALLKDDERTQCALSCVGSLTISSDILDAVECASCALKSTNEERTACALSCVGVDFVFEKQCEDLCEGNTPCADRCQQSANTCTQCQYESSAEAVELCILRNCVASSVLETKCAETFNTPESEGLCLQCLECVLVTGEDRKNCVTDCVKKFPRVNETCWDKVCKPICSEKNYRLANCTQYCQGDDLCIQRCKDTCLKQCGDAFCDNCGRCGTRIDNDIIKDCIVLNCIDDFAINVLCQEHCSSQEMYYVKPQLCFDLCTQNCHYCGHDVINNGNSAGDSRHQCVNECFYLTDCEARCSRDNSIPLEIEMCKQDCRECGYCSRKPFTSQKKCFKECRHEIDLQAECKPLCNSIAGKHGNDAVSNCQSICIGCIHCDSKNETEQKICLEQCALDSFNGYKAQVCSDICEYALDSEACYEKCNDCNKCIMAIGRENIVKCVIDTCLNVNIVLGGHCQSLCAAEEHSGLCEEQCLQCNLCAYKNTTEERMHCLKKCLAPKLLQTECSNVCTNITVQKSCLNTCEECGHCIDWPAGQSRLACVQTCLEGRVLINFCENYCTDVSNKPSCLYACSICPQCLYENDVDACILNCTGTYSGQMLFDGCAALCESYPDVERCNVVCNDYCARCAREIDQQSCLDDCIKSEDYDFYANQKEVAERRAREDEGYRKNKLGGMCDLLFGNLLDFFDCKMMGGPQPLSETNYLLECPQVAHDNLYLYYSDLIYYFEDVQEFYRNMEDALDATLAGLTCACGMCNYELYQLQSQLGTCQPGVWYVTPYVAATIPWNELMCDLSQWLTCQPRTCPPGTPVSGLTAAKGISCPLCTLATCHQTTSITAMCGKVPTVMSMSGMTSHPYPWNMKLCHEYVHETDDTCTVDGAFWRKYVSADALRNPCHLIIEINKLKTYTHKLHAEILAGTISHLQALKANAKTCAKKASCPSPVVAYVKLLRSMWDQANNVDVGGKIWDTKKFEERTNTWTIVASDYLEDIGRGAKGFSILGPVEDRLGANIKEWASGLGDKIRGTFSEFGKNLNFNIGSSGSGAFGSSRPGGRSIFGDFTISLGKFTQSETFQTVKKGVGVGAGIAADIMAKNYGSLEKRLIMVPRYVSPLCVPVPAGMAKSSVQSLGQEYMSNLKETFTPPKFTFDQSNKAPSGMAGLSGPTGCPGFPLSCIDLSFAGFSTIPDKSQAENVCWKATLFPKCGLEAFAKSSPGDAFWHYEDCLLYMSLADVSDLGGETVSDVDCYDVSDNTQCNNGNGVCCDEYCIPGAQQCDLGEECTDKDDGMPCDNENGVCCDEFCIPGAAQCDFEDECVGRINGDICESGNGMCCSEMCVVGPPLSCNGDPTSCFEKADGTECNSAGLDGICCSELCLPAATSCAGTDEECRNMADGKACELGQGLCCRNSCFIGATSCTTTNECDTKLDGSMCDGGKGMCCQHQCIPGASGSGIDSDECYGTIDNSVCNEGKGLCCSFYCIPDAVHCGGDSECALEIDGSLCNKGDGLCCRGKCIPEAKSCSSDVKGDPICIGKIDGTTCLDGNGICCGDYCIPGTMSCDFEDECVSLSEGNDCESGNGMCCNGKCVLNATQCYMGQSQCRGKTNNMACDEGLCCDSSCIKNAILCGGTDAECRNKPDKTRCAQGKGLCCRESCFVNATDCSITNECHNRQDLFGCDHGNGICCMQKCIPGATACETESNECVRKADYMSCYFGQGLCCEGKCLPGAESCGVQTPLPPGHQDISSTCGKECVQLYGSDYYCHPQEKKCACVGEYGPIIIDSIDCMPPIDHILYSNMAFCCKLEGYDAIDLCYGSDSYATYCCSGPFSEIPISSECLAKPFSKIQLVKASWQINNDDITIIKSGSDVTLKIILFNEGDRLKDETLRVKLYISNGRIIEKIVSNITIEKDNSKTIELFIEAEELVANEFIRPEIDIVFLTDESIELQKSDTFASVFVAPDNKISIVNSYFIEQNNIITKTWPNKLIKTKLSLYSSKKHAEHVNLTLFVYADNLLVSTQDLSVNLDPYILVDVFTNDYILDERSINSKVTLRVKIVHEDSTTIIDLDPNKYKHAQLVLEPPQLIVESLDFLNSDKHIVTSLLPNKKSYAVFDLKNTYTMSFEGEIIVNIKDSSGKEILKVIENLILLPGEKIEYKTDTFLSELRKNYKENEYVLTIEANSLLNSWLSVTNATYSIACIPISTQRTNQIVVSSHFSDCNLAIHCLNCNNECEITISKECNVIFSACDCECKSNRIRS